MNTSDSSNRKRRRSNSWKFITADSILFGVISGVLVLVYNVIKGAAKDWNGVIEAIIEIGMLLCIALLIRWLFRWRAGK